MLMNGILVLAALGALGACFGLGSFSSLAFLWQLPLLFAGLWLGLVLLAFLFLVLWCLPISLDQPVEADSKADRRVLYLYEELALTLLQVKIHTTGLEKLPQEGASSWCATISACWTPSSSTSIPKKASWPLFPSGKMTSSSS